MSKHLIAQYKSDSICFSRKDSGVYKLISEGECIYVGSGFNVRARLAHHEHIGKCDSVHVIYCDSADLSELETKLITELNPKLNIRKMGNRKKTAFQRCAPQHLLVFARERRGLSQRALARLAGVDQADLWRIESGRRKPSLEAAEKIVQVITELSEMHLLYPERYTEAA